MKMYVWVARYGRARLGDLYISTQRPYICPEGYFLYDWRTTSLDSYGNVAHAEVALKQWMESQLGQEIPEKPEYLEVEW